MQLSSFQGDESSVDAQGFLLNSSGSQSDLHNKERKEEEEVDDVDDDDDDDDDDERNKFHPAEQVVGYDLSPFTPSDDDMNYFFENAAKEECCVKVDTNASWSGEEKNQEESLLQKGGTKEQLARIEMYNTREADSDSDDDDNDREEEEKMVGGKIEIANEEEEMKGEGNEKPAEIDYEGYAGLRDDDDEEEEEEEDEHEQEDNCLSNEQDGNGCLQNDNLSSTETSNLDPSSVDIGGVSGGNVEFSHPQTDLDSTGTTMEDRSSKPAFATTVPLLKPPPKEKMEAYLKSKGWNKM